MQGHELCQGRSKTGKFIADACDTKRYTQSLLRNDAGKAGLKDESGSLKLCTGIHVARQVRPLQTVDTGCLRTPEPCHVFIDQGKLMGYPPS